MTSTVAWLDADDEQRRQMREAIELFRQEGAVDELGLGRIRDAISDRLFPGTSVLWRRARYLLFVPWIYQLLEQGQPNHSAPPAERARLLQVTLAKTLKTWADSEKDPSINTDGIIGRRKANVTQAPDNNIWAGLRKWGILTSPIRRSVACREAVERSRHPNELSANDSPPESIWNPQLPPIPKDFPRQATMELEAPEAEFLASLLEQGPALPDDLLAERRRGSLLPVLLDATDGQFKAARTPLYLGLKGISSSLSETLEMAACFSHVMRAAQLLYVELVCQKRDDDDAHEVLEDLRASWAEWQNAPDFDRERLRWWDEKLDLFESQIREINPRIGPRDFSFVREWTGHVLDTPDGKYPSSEKARKLVAERENSVKIGKSRIPLRDKPGLDMGVGVPGKLIFRWDVAHNVIADIRKGRVG